MLPPARGRLSAWLSAALRRTPSAQSGLPIPSRISAHSPVAWRDEDFQLALWCCYELHYRGFEDVDDAWEWHPAVTAFRVRLERRWVADR